MNTIIFIWMVAVPISGALLIYLLGRLGVRQGILPRRSGVVRWSAFAASLLTWMPFLLAVRDYYEHRAGVFNIEAIWLELDGMSLLIAFIVLLLGTLVILFSGPYMADEMGEEKFYVMLLIMMGVMIGLSCASDLFNLWVWFEAMAVSSYLLVAFYRRQPASLEAGIKYLVQSAVGSVLVLVGIAAVLADVHTLALSQIRLLASPSPTLLVAGALFMIGFGVKIAMVPMHTWLPDAHAQAPSGISAMLSGIVIEVGLLALLRVLAALAGVTDAWSFLLMGFGAMNMLYGNLLALKQRQVKRLLAYSSISQVGYVLLGLGITFYSHQGGGAQGAYLHIFNHAIMKGLAFLAAGALLYALKLSLGNHDPLEVEDLAGASSRYPIAAFALSLAVLGLGGLPPLAGFMSKWQIFAAGMATRDAVVISLVIFAALNSVLSLAYYAPLVNTMYRKKPGQAVEAGVKIPVTMLVPLGILALLAVLLGFWPGAMDWLIEPASQSLLTGIIG